MSLESLVVGQGSHVMGQSWPVRGSGSGVVGHRLGQGSRVKRSLVRDRWSGVMGQGSWVRGCRSVFAGQGSRIRDCGSGVMGHRSDVAVQGSRVIDRRSLVAVSFFKKVEGGILGR